MTMDYYVDELRDLYDDQQKIDAVVKFYNSSEHFDDGVFEFIAAQGPLGDWRVRVRSTSGHNLAQGDLKIIDERIRLANFSQT